jgi:hypothetical protein
MAAMQQSTPVAIAARDAASAPAGAFGAEAFARQLSSPSQATRMHVNGRMRYQAAPLIHKRVVAARQAHPPVPTTPAPDPNFAEMLKRMHYLPTAVTDTTTKHVLTALEKAAASNGTAPLFDCASMAQCPAALQPGSESAAAQRDPVLLVMVMPWFDVMTGHVRLWTLLHRFRYPCLLRQVYHTHKNAAGPATARAPRAALAALGSARTPRAALAALARANAASGQCSCAAASRRMARPVMCTS